MAAIVVAPPAAATTAASAAKPTTAAATTSTARTICFRFGLVDGQGSSAQIGPVERRNRFVSLAGIGHFDESETAGAARIPVGHESNFLHRAMGLEQISQLGFGGAVGEVSNVQVLHRNSSLNKSSKLVGVGIRFDGRPS
jgi:hypothetical protein